MNFLLVFGFSLLAVSSCVPYWERIPEPDKEVIRELNRNVVKLEESVLLDTNATVIAVYKSILQHNIADESVLKAARDYLNEWENATDKYPPISYFLRMANLYNPDKIVENEWTQWTSGAFNEIFANLMRVLEQYKLKREEKVRFAVSKLSDSTKTLLKNKYGDGYFESSVEGDQYLYLYNGIWSEISRNDIEV